MRFSFSLMIAFALMLWPRLAEAQNGGQNLTGVWSVSKEDLAAELLVDFSEVDPETLQALSQATGLKFRFNSEFSDADENLALVAVHSAANLQRLKALLTRRDDVEGFELNRTMQAYWTPDDPKLKSQWHMDMIKAQQAWTYSRGRGVVVAVLDTGLSTGNGQLKRLEDFAQSRFVAGYDFVDDKRSTDDPHGHGSHVAGTIAQNTNNGLGVAGVAFEARIMPIRVLDALGRGRISDIAEAIRWATQHGADVINMSLGSAMPAKIIAKEVAYARAHGVVVVCAAGNSGGRGVGFPAANKGALAVSALDPKGQLAFYSSWGPQVFISAPGGDTRFDYNHDGLRDGVLQNTIVPGDPSRQGYFPFQGTSMAAPHVAGVAALIIAEGMSNPAEVEKILQSTASAKGDVNKYGAGLVNAEAALHKAIWDAGLLRLAFSIFLILLAIFVGKGRKGGFGQQLSVLLVLGLLMGSSGLFMLRSLETWLPGAFVLTRPILEWPGYLLGWRWHLNIFVGSALLPLLLTVLFYGVKPLRALVAGLSLGIAAYLLACSLDGRVDLRWMPGLAGLFDRSWLLLNALFAWLLGALALPNRKG